VTIVSARLKNKRFLWNLLLLPPYIALLAPAFYSKAEPPLFGFPFFYWYQFAWVIIAAALTAIVYRRAA
jgi:hypothetical protein